MPWSKNKSKHALMHAKELTSILYKEIVRTIGVAVHSENQRRTIYI